MDKPTATRRQFLIRSLTGASSMWLAAQWPAILDASAYARKAETGAPDKFEFFTPGQAREIEAMAAQIIPSDETPGAREARVIHFIDRALITFDLEQQGVYASGLVNLVSKVNEMFPGSGTFSGLTSSQQIQALKAIEDTNFFFVTRLHTVMGFLSNPDYGGNHERMGWKVIGFTDEYAYQPPFGYYDAQANEEEGDGKK